MRLLVFVLTLLALFAGAGVDRAAADHERARAGVQAGAIRPLNEVLAKVRGRFPGRMLDARLVRAGPGNVWIYHLKVLTSQGRVLDLTVDARTANILRVR